MKKHTDSTSISGETFALAKKISRYNFGFCFLGTITVLVILIMFPLRNLAVNMIGTPDAENKLTSVLAGILITSIIMKVPLFFGRANLLSEPRYQAALELRKELKKFKKLFGRSFESLSEPVLFIAEQLMKKVALVRELQSKELPEARAHRVILGKMYDSGRYFCQVPSYNTLFA